MPDTTTNNSDPKTPLMGNAANQIETLKDKMIQSQKMYEEDPKSLLSIQDDLKACEMEFNAITDPSQIEEMVNWMIDNLGEVSYELFKSTSMNYELFDQSTSMNQVSLYALVLEATLHKHAFSKQKAPLFIEEYNNIAKKINNKSNIKIKCLAPQKHSMFSIRSFLNDPQLADALKSQIDPFTILQDQYDEETDQKRKGEYGQLIRIARNHQQRGILGKTQGYILNMAKAYKLTDIARTNNNLSMIPIYKDLFNGAKRRLISWDKNGHDVRPPIFGSRYNAALGIIKRDEEKRKTDAGKNQTSQSTSSVGLFSGAEDFAKGVFMAAEGAGTVLKFFCVMT